MSRAIRVSIPAGGTLVDDVADAAFRDGDVWIDVSHSSVNFKDALALRGKPGVIRDAGTIAGIDLVGTVSASESASWDVGDRVLVNGCGLGEGRDGGLAERARVHSDWLVAVPSTMSSAQAAAVGTAGFTAMLAVMALERHGVTGEVLVTGATGGVGSIAVSLLSTLGFSVAASTGKESEHDYLRALGASTIIDRAALSEPGKPLQSQRWGGAIDSVGSQTLANVLAQTSYGGLVASCGLAAGADLPTTVMPFILRGITLHGVNSVWCPTDLRHAAWHRLGHDLDLRSLDSMTTTVGLSGAMEVAERMLRGEVRGRVVVDVQH